MSMDLLLNINKSFNSQSELTIEYIETFLKSTPINKKDVESYLLEPERFPMIMPALTAQCL
jgi:hypothetical protein